jgi:hypothetical protein
MDLYLPHQQTKSHVSLELIAADCMIKCSDLLVSGIRMTSDPAKKRLDIVAVSDSLAGLFAGTSLRRLGHNVKILERSPTPLLYY